MAETQQVKLLVIGAGPAGYTAAVYAARANLAPMLLQGLQPGGQLSITTDVENYPGFAEAIQGPWLMDQMADQARNCGTEVVFDIATEVDFSKRPFAVKTDGGTTIEAETIVIATGAVARWLGLESEQKFSGFGVSACATCDGFFFRNKPVVVIGGGNTAVEEALYLSKICQQVKLIHRRDSLRAEKILQDRLFKTANIDVIWDHNVVEVLGTDEPKTVNGVVIEHAKSGEKQELAVDGVFVAIGHDPATALFKGQIEMDDNGYIITKPDSTATNIPGVFAAGDVQDHIFRQAVTAAGTGCMAALEAERFLAAQDG